MVDLSGSLCEVTAEANKYYIPLASNDSFFVSFTIDEVQGAYVISIFTTSAKHRGSESSEGSLGHWQQPIRKLVAHVRKLTQSARSKTDVEVAVRYVLVCPERRKYYDDSQKYSYSWRLPIGWSKESCKVDERHEDVSCIIVPVPVPVPYHLW